MSHAMNFFDIFNDFSNISSKKIEKNFELHTKSFVTWEREGAWSTEA
jgi:hypothetical protein